MTPRLVLTGQNSFEEITTFFKEAGPDARIRAKKHGDVVELYVRDLSIKGRLQEWWKTNSDQRKKCYESAKLQIQLSILNNNNKAVEEATQFGYQFEAHKQDFVASEILNLEQKINAKNELDAVFTNFEVPKSIDHVLKEEFRLSKPEALQVMAQALGQVKPDKLAKVLSNLSNGKFSERELRQNFSDFLKVVKLNSGENTSKNNLEAVDFVSARKFLIALKDAAALGHAAFPESRKPDVSSFVHDIPSINENTWNLLDALVQHLPATSDPEAN